MTIKTMKTMMMNKQTQSAPQDPRVAPVQGDISSPGRSWCEVETVPCDVPSVAAGLSHLERLPNFIAGPSDVASRLRALAVVVIGCGSVGARIADSLARMGIGSLSLCDARRSKAVSLLTHPLSPDEVGSYKADLMARRAKLLSPNTRVRFFVGAFEALPFDALADASAVVISTDNLAAEVAVTQSCLHLGLPLYQASVYGPGLVAQVRSVRGGEDGLGPCLCCGFGAAEWTDLDRGTLFSCEGGAAPVLSAAPQAAALPTTSPPHLCSMAADLAVGALLCDVLELGPEHNACRSQLFRGYTGSTLSTALRRNLECPMDHSHWSVCDAGSPLHELSPGDLLCISGVGEADLHTTSLRVADHRFTSMSACDCDAHPLLCRFLADGCGLGLCEACGHELSPHPLHSYQVVPFAVLEKSLTCRLEDLGVAATSAVLVRSRHGTTLVRFPGLPPGPDHPLNSPSNITRSPATDLAESQKVSTP